MPPVVDDGGGLFAALAGYAHDSLSAVIPAPLFAILAGFSNLIYRLVLGVSNDPSSWYSTLLPPFIALGMAYISLVLAYRTVRSTILVVWWGIKWGAILGAGIALWAWWVGEGDAIQSQGQVPSSSWASWAANGASIAGAAPLLSTLYSHLEGSGSSSSSSRRRGASSSRRRRGTSAAAAASSEDQNTVVASLLETLGVSSSLSRSIVDAVSAADGSGLGAGAEEWMQRIAAEMGGGGGEGVPRSGSGDGGPAYNTRSQAQRSRRGRGSGTRAGSRSRSETPRDDDDGEESLAGQVLRGLFRRFADEANA